jgi:progressive ankylosis protein
MIVLVIPALFYFIAEDLIGLPAEVSHLTHLAMIIMIPWPGAIGFRRFYQGVLIRNNLTRKVAYGTIIRLLTIPQQHSVYFILQKLPGALVGAAALSIAVVFEAIASQDYGNKIVRQNKR